MVGTIMTSGLSDHPSTSVRPNIGCCKSLEHFGCWVKHCSAVRILSWRITDPHPWTKGGLIEGFYPSAKVQSVSFFIDPADRAVYLLFLWLYVFSWNFLMVSLYQSTVDREVAQILFIILSSEWLLLIHLYVLFLFCFVWVWNLFFEIVIICLYVCMWVWVNVYMRSKWPYMCYSEGSRSRIYSFKYSSHLTFTSCLIIVQVVQPYGSTDTTTAREKSFFILSEIRFPYD